MVGSWLGGFLSTAISAFGARSVTPEDRLPPPGPLPADPEPLPEPLPDPCPGVEPSAGPLPVHLFVLSDPCPRRRSSWTAPMSLCWPVGSSVSGRSRGLLGRGQQLCCLRRDRPCGERARAAAAARGSAPGRGWTQAGGDEVVEVGRVEAHYRPLLTKRTRCSATSRRITRTGTPRRMAASFTSSSGRWSSGGGDGHGRSWVGGCSCLRNRCDAGPSCDKGWPTFSSRTLARSRRQAHRSVARCRVGPCPRRGHPCPIPCRPVWPLPDPLPGEQAARRDLRPRLRRRSGLADRPYREGGAPGCGARRLRAGLLRGPHRTSALHLP